MTSPAYLVRAGWKKTDLPVGAVIMSERANPSHDGSNTCFVGAITLEDGTPIFSGNKAAQQ